MARRRTPEHSVGRLASSATLIAPLSSCPRGTHTSGCDGCAMPWRTPLCWACRPSMSTGMRTFAAAGGARPARMRTEIRPLSVRPDIRRQARRVRNASMAQLGWQKPADGSNTLAISYDLDYIWKHVDRGPAKDAASYYIQASESGGEPPGRWWGPGAKALGFDHGQWVEREPYDLPAPRGASLYRPRSGQGWEELSLDQMANPRPERRRGR